MLMYSNDFNLCSNLTPLLKQNSKLICVFSRLYGAEKQLLLCCKLHCTHVQYVQRTISVFRCFLIFQNRDSRAECLEYAERESQSTDKICVENNDN
jgi:hypothetical protein